MTKRIVHTQDLGFESPKTTLVLAIDSLGGGGAQRQLVELARIINKSSHFRVIVQVYGTADFFLNKLIDENITVCRIAKKHRFDLCYIFRLKAWMKSQKVDLVHSFLLWPSFWFALSLIVTPRRERPRHLSAVRNAIPNQGLLSRLAELFTYRRCDHVTVNAETEVARIHTQCRIPISRLSYIPNGIELTAWPQKQDSVPNEPKGDDRFNLAVIGRFAPQKNHTLFLDALERIDCSTSANWLVRFVGDQTGNLAYAELIRSEIKQRGLCGIVKIEGPRLDVPQILLQMDAVVLSSAYEGFPNVILEAMASEVPVVATRVGDIPNMIQDQISGFICEVGNPASLAQALLKLERLGVNGRNKMGRNGRSKVVSHFSLDVVAERHKALYRAQLKPSYSRISSQSKESKQE